MIDEINEPRHYKFGDYEVYDICMAWLKEAPISHGIAADWFSMMQYLFRFPMKKGKQDLLKAEWYLRKIMEKYDDKS